MRTTSLCLLVIGVAACGTTTQATQINVAPRPLAPRPPETVEMFTTGAPPRPHVDLALIEVEQTSSYSVAGTPEMFAAMQKRGAAMGCDAVVFHGISTQDPGIGSVERLVEDHPGSRKGIYGTCIVYTSPEDVALAEAGRVQHANADCLERRRETLALADRVDDPRSKANIAGAAPRCDAPGAR